MKGLKLLIPIAIAVVMFVSNPPVEDHIAKVKAAYVELVDNEVDDSGLGKNLNKIAKGIGGLIVDGTIDSRVSRDNYLIFSITKFKRKDSSEPVGIGVFGNVFLFGDPEFDKEKLKRQWNID